MDSSGEMIHYSSNTLCPVEPNSRYAEVYSMYLTNVVNGNLVEALQNCRRMIKLSKYTCFPTSWLCCALILSSGANERLGAFEEALKDAKEALKFAPTKTLIGNWYVRFRFMILNFHFISFLLLFFAVI